MKNATLNDSKNIQFEILKKIRTICEENGIRYYLAYGSLLGAVRHKGFIPWDDDIDIVMPRPDYSKFVKLANDQQFTLYSIETHRDHIYSFAKASDNNTLIKADGVRCKIDLGVSVDIFPIDGAGDAEEEGKESFDKTAIMYGMCIAATWKKYIKGRTKNKKKNLMRFGSFILSRFVNPRKILEKYNNLISNKDYNKSEYVAVYSSPYRTKEVMSRKIYGDGTKVSFEGELFNAPQDYDAYLTHIYGDYMKLPPEEDRKPLHTTNIYYKEG